MTAAGRRTIRLPAPLLAEIQDIHARFARHGLDLPEVAILRAALVKGARDLRADLDSLGGGAVVARRKVNPHSLKDAK